MASKPKKTQAAKPSNTAPSPMATPTPVMIAAPPPVPPAGPMPAMPLAPAQPATPRPVYLAFSSEVNQLTGPALLGAIAQQMMLGHDELHLMLSTPGGHVAQGISIYNTLKAMPIKITTYNVGSVNSIGNVIFLAGNKRYASRTSSFMFHGVGFDVQAARFEEKVLKERLQGLQNDQKLIADIIVRHTKINAAAAEKLFLEAAFLRPKEAKRLGIIDNIIDVQIPKGAPFLQLVFQR